MSGGLRSGTSNKDNTEAPIVQEVMKMFNVDHSTAMRIIAWSSLQAMEKVQKWKRNLEKKKNEK